jgi:hypothetical protein
LPRGDPLGALNRVALRDDAPALALRASRWAQLGDFVRARDLPAARRNARSAPAKRSRGRAAWSPRPRSRSSRATIAWPTQALRAGTHHARVAAGDGVNAAHAGYLEVRRLVLVGPTRRRGAVLATLDPAGDAGIPPGRGCARGGEHRDRGTCKRRQPGSPCAGSKRCGARIDSRIERRK